MAHRPLVWLLVALASLGAGWAAYGPLRHALQPATDTAERSSLTEGVAAPEGRVAAPPVTAPPTPVPAPAASAPETPRTGPVEPASEGQPRLTETPTAPAAVTPDAPAVAGVPAGARPPPTGVEPGGQATALRPAPVEGAAAPGLREAVVPQAESSAKGAAEPRLSELAPAAGQPARPASPAAPSTPLKPTPEGPLAAVSPDSAAPVPPEAAAAAVVEPSARPPATGPVAPEASAEARAPPAAPVEGPSVPAEVAKSTPLAKTTPLPSTEPAAPEAGAEAAEPAPARSLILDTIRRALAALLGGTREPTDPVAPRAEVEKPGPDSPAVRPDRAQDLAKATEPSAGGSELVRPSFDIVRVEPGGRAVVAGRAAPGAEVELLAGERVLDRVRANRRGEWIATPIEPLAPGGLELSLRATSAGGPAVGAAQVVVVVVPEPPPPQPAPVAVAEGPPPQPPPVAGAEGPPPQPAEVRLAEATTGPLAVLLAGDGRAPGRILQAPGRISSDGSLALLVLDYDDSGHTRLTGEAPPGAPLRIYVDNEPAAEVVTEPSGRWTAVLGHDLAPGEYTLRLDQLGSQGRPVARLETPFTRVSQPPIQGKTQVDYVIVQPGNSLWRIARRLFGSGMDYVQIYDANQAQIRDPDLIYPGQVFEVPAGLGSAG